MAEINKGQRAVRPEFRNLGLGEILRYRMPPPAIVSILHRVSGVLLFLVGIPFILYLFQNSLTSELSFEVYRGGHMLYTHAPSRDAFTADAKVFYAQGAEKK